MKNECFALFKLVLSYFYTFNFVSITWRRHCPQTLEVAFRTPCSLELLLRIVMSSVSSNWMMRPQMTAGGRGGGARGGWDWDQFGCVKTTGTDCLDKSGGKAKPGHLWDSLSFMWARPGLLVAFLMERKIHLTQLCLCCWILINSGKWGCATSHSCASHWELIRGIYIVKIPCWN